jgi:hypothetical protein
MQGKLANVEQERKLIPDDGVERPTRAEREEFFIAEEVPHVTQELSPLVEVFRAQLIPCLEECRTGRSGLFLDAGLVDGADSWPEATKLRELAFALQQIFSQDGDRCAIVDEFLDLCTIHGENNPGEKRLARLFLDRIEKENVGTPTEPPPPWMQKPEVKP